MRACRVEILACRVYMRAGTVNMCTCRNIRPGARARHVSVQGRHARVEGLHARVKALHAPVQGLHPRVKN